MSVKVGDKVLSSSKWSYLLGLGVSGNTEKAQKFLESIPAPDPNAVLEKKRQDYIKYMENPAYKERLKKELINTYLGEGMPDADQENEVNEIYEQRLNNIKTAKLVDFNNFDWESHTSWKNNNANAPKGNIGGFSDPATGLIVAQEKNAYHELTHSAERYQNFAPGFSEASDKIAEQNKDKEFPLYPDYDRSYFKDPAEQKARINQLRLDAIKNYGYDQSKPFNINDYPELKKSSSYRDLNIMNNYSDDDINELSKYVASNDKRQPRNMA